MSAINYDELFRDIYELKYMEKKEAPQSCIIINKQGGISFSKGLLDNLFPVKDDNISSQEGKVPSARKIAIKTNEEKLEAIYKALSSEEVISEDAKQKLSDLINKDASNVTKATLKEFLYTNCLTVEFIPNPQKEDGVKVFTLNDQNNISNAWLADILGRDKNINIRYEVNNNKVDFSTREEVDVKNRKKND